MIRGSNSGRMERCFQMARSFVCEGTVIVGGLIGGDVGLRAEGTVIVGGLIGGDVGLRARLLLVG